MRRIASVVLFAGWFGSAAVAGPIQSRPALTALLAGGTSHTDTFQSYTRVAPQDGFNGPLTATAVVNGQTGLVGPGATYSRAAAPRSPHDLYLAGPGYFGLASNVLLAGGRALAVDFATPVEAFGVDIRDYGGFSHSGVMTVLTGSQVIDEFIYSVDDETPRFAGYHHPAGITRVVFTSSNSWSPLIDNVTYGRVTAAAVPEPLSVAVFGGLLAAGRLVARRQRRSTAD